MSQVLYRKWRPQIWDEVVGQDHIILTIRNAVKGERISHAYLFAGPRGTGKTTTARLLAKAVNCLDANPEHRPCNKCEHCVLIRDGRFLDIIEIDAASNTSVEDVRELRERINFSPNKGRYKVYIIDEVHMLSTAAFNALLKTLEEPPAHAIFVLATTEVHKIPATVLSRCQRHEFRRLPVRVMVDYLRRQAKQEGIRVEPEAMEAIARQATGSLRDAISLLDQLASMGKEVTLPRAQEVLGTATATMVQELVGSLVEGDLGRGLTLINNSLDGGTDPRQLGRQLVNYLRHLLLIRLGSDSLVEVGPEILATMSQQAEQLEIDTLLAGIRAFSEAALGVRAAPQPGLPLELALVEVAGARDRKGDRAAGRRLDPNPPARETQTPRTNAEERVQTEAEIGEAPAIQIEADPGGAASAPTEGGGGGITFQSILDRWPDLLAVAQARDPKTQALLNSGKPLGLEGGSLILGFRSDLLREKMEKGHNLSALSDSLREVFGQQIGVRCVLVGQWGERTAPSGDALPLEEGGMVATALRDFGAQVINVEPLQRDAEQPEPPEEEG